VRCGADESIGEIGIFRDAENLVKRGVRGIGDFFVGHGLFSQQVADDFQSGCGNAFGLSSCFSSRLCFRLFGYPPGVLLPVLSWLHQHSIEMTSSVRPPLGNFRGMIA